LHRSKETDRGMREAGGGRRLLEQVVRLLQEGRELGIGVVVVDQSPASLAGAVLKNTNTKIIHRLEDGEEMEVIGRALGLKPEEWPDLGELEDGECLVKTKRSPHPFKLAPFPEEELERASPLPLLLEATPPRHARCSNCSTAGSRGRCPEQGERLRSRTVAAFWQQPRTGGFRFGKVSSLAEPDRRQASLELPHDRDDLLLQLARLPARICCSRECDELLLGTLANKLSLSSLRQATRIFSPGWLVSEASRLAAELAVVARLQAVPAESLRAAERAIRTWAYEAEETPDRLVSAGLLRLQLLQPILLASLTGTLVRRGFALAAPVPEVGVEVRRRDSMQGRSWSAPIAGLPAAGVSESSAARVPATPGRREIPRVDRALVRQATTLLCRDF